MKVNLVIYKHYTLSSIMAIWERDDDFSNKVARLCCEHFKKLDKKGKPQGKHEWTLMAAVVLIQEPG